jgi:hypothetical protein
MSKCIKCGCKLSWLATYCKLCDEEYNFHVGDFVKHKLTRDKGLLIHHNFREAVTWDVRMKDLSIKVFYEDELERI